MNPIYLCLLSAVLCLILPTQGTPGTATYYGAIESPGCGYGNPYSWVKDGLTGNGRVSGKILTAAVNENVYQEGLACGACYELSCVSADRNWGPGPGGCTGNTAIVTVTDLCPRAGNEQWCNNGKTHFDCAPDAWDVIAKDRVYGHIEIEFTRVPCNPTSGGVPEGVSVIVRGGSKTYWQSFALLYVAGSGSIKGMEVSDNGGGSWDACKHDHGAHWAHNDALENVALSFRITADNGQVLVLNNVVDGGWYGGGKTYGSEQNFGRTGGGSSEGNRVSRRRRIPPRNNRRKKGMHCGKGKYRNRPCRKGMKRTRRTQRH